MYIYMCIYIYIYKYIYVCVYIYIGHSYSSEIPTNKNNFIRQEASKIK